MDSKKKDLLRWKITQLFVLMLIRKSIPRNSQPSRTNMALIYCLVYYRDYSGAAGPGFSLEVMCMSICKCITGMW